MSYDSIKGDRVKWLSLDVRSRIRDSGRWNPVVVLRSERTWGAVLGRYECGSNNATYLMYQSAASGLDTNS